jgi:hypothetical protein
VLPLPCPSFFDSLLIFSLSICPFYPLLLTIDDGWEGERERERERENWVYEYIVVVTGDWTMRPFLCVSKF